MIWGGAAGKSDNFLKLSFFTEQYVEDIFPCQEIYCTVFIFYVIMKNDKYFQEPSSAVRVERYRDGQITGPTKS